MDDYEPYEDNDIAGGIEVQERNVFERVGLRHDVDIDIDPEKKRTQKTPIERFIEFTNAIAFDIVSKNKKLLNEQDIKIILQSISMMSRPEIKNPTAYILGYIATQGGNEINKDKLLATFDMLENLEDKSVQPPDVIRYSRLWLSFYNNLS